MEWYYWVGGAWLVFGGGGWVTGFARQTLNTRHERKVELLATEGRKQQAIAAANKPPEPICGCTHHLAKHDKKGQCHERVEAPIAWDADKKPTQYEAQRCNCQQYIGPRPLDILYAEELTDPDMV